jgi:signal transduction histidine kinase/CheY-like chemotaxis protein
VKQKLKTLKQGCARRLWAFSSPWRQLPEISGAVGKSEIEKKISYIGFEKILKTSWEMWYLAAVTFTVWALVIWPFTDKKITVVVWLSLGILCIAWGKWVGLFNVPPHASKELLRHKEKLIGRVSIIGNTLWGCAVFTLPSGTREFDAYYVMMMMLVSTCYMGLYSLYRPGMLWGGLPPVLIAAVTLFSRGDGLRILTAFIFLLAMVEIFRIANTSGKMIEAALISEEEKKLLLEELHIRRVEAETANLAKTRFLTAASHDLRQPIHSVALLLGVLRQSSSPPTTHLIDRLETSVQNMDRLLNAVMEASTLDSQKISIATDCFSIKPILDRLKNQFELQAQEKNIQFSVQTIEQHVVVDSFQLHRILSNFLSNAIVYTPQHGKVCVRCRVRNEQLWIQVWDNGLGIAHAEIKNIFNEFYQVSASKEEMQVSGLGLGLYIVKRIAQQLGHPIQVRSRLGRGSVFSVGIPCAAQATTIIENTTDIKNEIFEQLIKLLGGLLVLVIEDDARVLKDIEIFLTSLHCQVLCAKSGHAALSLVSDTLRTPDLIVSDYRLGQGMNGVEAIENIRTLVAQKIPALLLTAEYVPQPSGDEKFHGIPVVSKPINLALFAQTLDQILVGLTQKHPS